MFVQTFFLGWITNKAPAWGKKFWDGKDGIGKLFKSNAEEDLEGHDQDEIENSPLNIQGKIWILTFVQFLWNMQLLLVNTSELRTRGIAFMD